MVFDVFYDNKYQHVWPGIVDDTKIKQQIQDEMEPLFYKCFNTIVTRCFGWGLPKTSLIPFADCINHHNVDSTYEFICRDLHEPIKDMYYDQSTYELTVEDYLKTGLDNPENMDD